MNIGTPEIIVIMLLALLIYGKRMPEIMRAVGKGYRGFKASLSGVEESLRKEVQGIDKKIIEADKLYDQPAQADKKDTPDKNELVPKPAPPSSPKTDSVEKEINPNDLAG